VNDYPSPIVPINHVEPVPRRIRASLGGGTVLDTTASCQRWLLHPKVVGVDPDSQHTLAVRYVYT
jgi:predicted dinucleotide-binding enzyme